MFFFGLGTVPQPAFCVTKGIGLEGLVTIITRRPAGDTLSSASQPFIPAAGSSPESPEAFAPPSLSLCRNGLQVRPVPPVSLPSPLSPV